MRTTRDEKPPERANSGVVHRCVTRVGWHRTTSLIALPKSWALANGLEQGRRIPLASAGRFVIVGPPDSEEEVRDLVAELSRRFP